MWAWGVCRICGCTDNNACVNSEGNACFWVDSEHNLCSACVEERSEEWEKKLRAASYEMVAPDGAIWEFAQGEWTSRSYPDAVYDTEDLAYLLANLEITE